jgi:hypothetical protein
MISKGNQGISDQQVVRCGKADCERHIDRAAAVGVERDRRCATMPECYLYKICHASVNFRGQVDLYVRRLLIKGCRPEANFDCVFKFVMGTRVHVCPRKLTLSYADPRPCAALVNMALSNGASISKFSMDFI